MKALKRKSATIPNSRWLAYATAGVASAFTYANSAQAAIHYSGDLHEQFGRTRRSSMRFRWIRPVMIFSLNVILDQTPAKPPFFVTESFRMLSGVLGPTI
jgi:hypothetical protein